MAEKNAGDYESPSPKGKGKAASTNAENKAFLEAGKSLLDQYGGAPDSNYDNRPGKAVGGTLSSPARG